MADISREAAARNLAQLLAIARQHYGIPEPAQRLEPPPAAQATLLATYLPRIIELYSDNYTFGQIAAELELKQDQVINLVTYARRRGNWPPELRRKPSPAARPELLPV